MIAHLCAATHRAFGRPRDAPINARVAAHICKASLEQYTPKGASEIFVEYGVDRWIQGRVHVAQPKCNVERRLGNVAFGAHRRQNVQEEERQPARDEAAHDQAEDERGAFLLFAGDAPLLLFRVALLLYFRNGRLEFGALGDVLVRLGLHFDGLVVVALAEYRLAQPELERLDHRTAADHARIGARRVEFADHVVVDAHRQRPASAERRRHLQLVGRRRRTGPVRRGLGLVRWRRCGARPRRHL